MKDRPCHSESTSSSHQGAFLWINLNDSHDGNILFLIKSTLTNTKNKPLGPLLKLGKPTQIKIYVLWHSKHRSCPTPCAKEHQMDVLMNCSWLKTDGNHQPLGASSVCGYTWIHTSQSPHIACEEPRTGWTYQVLRSTLCFNLVWASLTISVENNSHKQNHLPGNVRNWNHSFIFLQYKLLGSTQNLNKDCQVSTYSV